MKNIARKPELVVKVFGGGVKEHSDATAASISERLSKINVGIIETEEVVGGDSLAFVL